MSPYSAISSAYFSYLPDTANNLAKKDSKDFTAIRLTKIMT